MSNSVSKLKLWSIVVLAVLVGVVVVQNTDSVQTKILWMTIEMPRVLLLLTMTLVGFVIGAVTFGRRGRGGGRPKG